MESHGERPGTMETTKGGGGREGGRRRGGKIVEEDQVRTSLKCEGEGREGKPIQRMGEGRQGQGPRDQG